jgi:hypothetical protein
MTYESVKDVESKIAPGVRFRVARMSFARRVELMRQVRELARRMEFLEAGQEPAEKMDSVLAQVEVDRLYLMWGLVEVCGLEVDGAAATPGTLVESGPEDLFREALAAVKAETGLSGTERKN